LAFIGLRWSGGDSFGELGEDLRGVLEAVAAHVEYFYGGDEEEEGEDEEEARDGHGWCNISYKSY